MQYNKCLSKTNYLNSHVQSICLPSDTNYYTYELLTQKTQ